MGFDVLRAAGAFAVVWIHACDTSPLALRLSSFAGFAVPCFCLMSFFLLQRKLLFGAPDGVAGVLRDRLVRLVPAYLAWTVIYLVARLVKHMMLGATPIEVEWTSWLLLGGASYQLYFIPVLIGLSVLFVPLLGLVTRLGRRTMIFLLAGVSIVLFMVSWQCGGWEPCRRWPFAVRQVVNLAWFVPLSAGLAIASPTGMNPGRGGKAVCVAFACLAVGLAFAGVFRGVACVPAVALPVFGVALLRWDVRLPGWVMRLSVLSFGIFLSHGLFVEGLQALLALVGVGLESLPVTLGVIVSSFVGAWGLCEVMSRTVAMRRLIQ